MEKKGPVDQFPEIMQLLGEGAPRFPPIDGLGLAWSVVTSYLQKFIHISRAHQSSPVLADSMYFLCKTFMFLQFPQTLRFVSKFPQT